MKDWHIADLGSHRLSSLQAPPRIQTQPSLPLLARLLRPRPREIPRSIVKARRRARPRPHGIRPVRNTRPRPKRLLSRATNKVRMAFTPPGRGVQARGAVPPRAIEPIGREVLGREAPLLVEVDLVLGRWRDLDDALCRCRRDYCGRHCDYQVARDGVCVCLPRDDGAGC